MTTKSAEAALIVDHVWRSPMRSGSRGGRIIGRGPLADRLCVYMNCRRPRTEHARSVLLREKGGQD